MTIQNNDHYAVADVIWEQVYVIFSSTEHDNNMQCHIFMLIFSYEIHTDFSAMISFYLEYLQLDKCFTRTL